MSKVTSTLRSLRPTSTALALATFLALALIFAGLQAIAQ